MTRQPASGLDLTHAEPKPHVCARAHRPRVREWDPASPAHDRDGIMHVRVLPYGTRWTCPLCGTIWVVVQKPDVHRGFTYMVGGPEWRPETRRQRRQRPGLRWWQRG